MQFRSPSADVRDTRGLLWLVLWILFAFALSSRAEEAALTQGVMTYRWQTEAGSDEEGSATLALPLKKTRVKAEVSGFVARVTVQQFFSNPTTKRIEAIYQFPLPENAAVHESVLRIGDRVVRAEIKEREKAKKTYEKAKKQGKKASLLEQERPNIFTQSVANIEPGEEIVAALQYVQEVHYDEGAWRFSFPMTIGPRFNPGVATGKQGPGTSPDTDQVPDASRITPPVLPPSLRSGRDIELAVTLRAGFPVREIASPSHELDLQWEGTKTVTASLAPDDRIPNKDFVLAWDTVGPDLEAAVLAHKQGDTGYFLLMVQPPAEVAPEEAVPKEMVFVLDCSGSMSGQPMAASKAVMRRFIEGMNPNDSFQVIRFSEKASALAERPLPNTPENRARGLAYVESLAGYGGTQMIEGIKAALDFPVDPDRQRMVFFLTDGYIGNETQILAAIEERKGDARLYSLGVGSSPNRYLVEEMARAGHGFAQYVRNDEDPTPQVELFTRRLAMPVMTNVAVDWNGLPVLDQEPEILPDVFDGRPVFLVGRYRSGGAATVFLRGRVGESIANVPVRVDLPSDEPAHGALRQLWARRRIGELMRLQHRREIPEVREEVLELSLEHRVLSKYTAFVAVEQRLRADLSLPLETILVPSELPEGMSYEGVFGEATLSLDRIKPGDPVLAVRAPEEAVAVLAEFPFGLRKRLERDPRTGLWVCRFLVPRGVEEGRHVIRIKIILPHGDWMTTEASYVVDATAPQLELKTELREGVLHLTAHPLAGVFAETHGETAPQAASETVEAYVLPDVLSVVVRPPQGGYVTLHREDGPEGPVWRGTYEIPSWYGEGVYTFRLYAVDEARNAFARDVRVPILRGVPDPTRKGGVQ